MVLWNRGSTWEKNWYWLNLWFLVGEGHYFQFLKSLLQYPMGKQGKKRGELVWGVGIGEIKFFYCFRSKKVVKRLIISNSENTDYFDLGWNAWIFSRSFIFSTKLKCSLMLKRFVVNLGKVPPRKAVPLMLPHLTAGTIS